MSLEYFWDLISVSVVGLVMLPFLLYILTGKKEFIFFGLGVLLLEFLVFVIKRILVFLFPKNKAFKRPSGACNCKSFNGGGKQEGRPGMPSGHLAATTFIVTYAYITGYVKIPSALYLVIGSIYIFLMGYSRIYKKCHTFSQVAIGAVLGTIFAKLWSLGL